MANPKRAESCVARLVVRSGKTTHNRHEAARHAYRRAVKEGRLLSGDLYAVDVAILDENDWETELSGEVPQPKGNKQVGAN